MRPADVPDCGPPRIDEPRSINLHPMADKIIQAFVRDSHRTTPHQAHIEAMYPARIAEHLSTMRFCDRLRFLAAVQLLPALESGEETLVGGQAVLEGVMMRSPHAWGITVRKPRASWSRTPSRWSVRRNSTSRWVEPSCAAMRRRTSPATSIGCTSASPSGATGRPR